MQVTVSADIDRNIEDVFAFVSDTTNDPLWCDTVRSVRQVEGEGPGPDARYHVVHAPIGKAIDYDVQTTAFQPPTEIAWRCEDRVSIFRVTIELAPLGEGRTRLSQTSDMTFKGLFRLLTPIAKREVGKTIREQFEALERVLAGDRESQAGT